MEKNKKVPCMLLMNDMHVSKDNIAEFHANWDEAVAVCHERGIRDIVVGGDLWQSRSAQTLDTLMAVHQAVTKATSEGIGITLAEGNHDKVDQESLFGYSHIFSKHPYVCVIDDYIIDAISPDTDLYVMSYFPENGSFVRRYRDMVENDLDSGKRNVLYIHEGISGALSMPVEGELPSGMFGDFDSVLVGHYHNRCKIKGTGIEYIGSSRQHNFGEDEEKGYTVLYTDGSHEFVKNRSNVRYKVIDIDIADMTDSFLGELQRIKDEGRYKVKVRVSCKPEEAPAIDRQKLSESGASKIELVTEQTLATAAEPQSISKKFDKRGVKKEYSDFCSDRNIENVNLGLQYLDKIR